MGFNGARPDGVAFRFSFRKRRINIFRAAKVNSGLESP